MPAPIVPRRFVGHVDSPATPSLDPARLGRAWASADGPLVAWRVEPGHRLRVILADQDPHHVVPEYRPYRARLFVDDARPSRVSLPLVAADSPPLSSG